MGNTPGVFGGSTGGSPAMPSQFGNQGQTELIQLVAGVSPGGALQVEPIIVDRNVAAPPMGRPIGNMQLDLARLVQELLAIAAGGRLLNQNMPALVASARERLCGEGKPLPADTPDDILQTIVSVSVEETIKLAISGG